MAKVVEPDISDLPADFLVCRDRNLGHAWASNDRHPFRYTSEGTERIAGKTWQRLSRASTCQRCGAEKTTRWRLAGNQFIQTGTSMKYPEGYLVPGGVKPPTLRFEQIRRSA